MTTRTSKVQRTTSETKICVDLNLDGSGKAEVQTGIGFLDHLITTLSCHGRFDIHLCCKGDLNVDDHHTAEDCALCLGRSIDEALGERRGIKRFGYAYAPLDESLSRAVVDLSGRPYAVANLALKRDALGELACENIEHFIRSLATSARASIHVDVLRGENDHHQAESAFKALALALRQAVARDGDSQCPSTKGVL